jgi:hypothetical protein
VISDYDGNGKLRSVATVPDDGSHLEELLSRALVDRLAYTAICLRSAHELRTTDALDPRLTPFVSKVLTGELAPPPRDNHRPRVGKQGPRDQVICLAIQRVVDLGFYATRSVSSSHDLSAIDIVVSALRDLKKEGSNAIKAMGYDQLNKIWRARVFRRTSDGKLAFYGPT